MMTEGEVPRRRRARRRHAGPEPEEQPAKLEHLSLGTCIAAFIASLVTFYFTSVKI
jgi:hypothetical protein